MVKAQNFHCSLVLPDVQSLKTGGGRYATTTVSHSGRSSPGTFIVGRSLHAREKFSHELTLAFANGKTQILSHEKREPE